MRATGQRLTRGDGGMVLDVGPEAGLDNLMSMVGMAKERGIDALLVTNCVPGDMAEPSRQAAERTGAPLLDTSELLEKALPDVLDGRIDPDEYHRYATLYGPAAMGDYPWLGVYLSDRCHPNRIGHELIAERLAAMVERSPSFTAYLSRRRD